MDQGPTEAIAALRDGLDRSWLDGARSVAERFRLLDADMKARIVAVAMAKAIASSERAHGETLLTHVARQVVPDMRAAWRPTGETFFGRIKKAQLVHLLAHDLHQPEEAARLGPSKKTDIVDYLERLFAAPFATLGPGQREAVETWCPPGMAIPELRERHSVPDADAAHAGAGAGAGEPDGNEAFDVDPGEAFDADEGSARTRTSRGRFRRPSPPDDPRSRLPEPPRP